jgi:hypothetical protein
MTRHDARARAATTSPTPVTHRWAATMMSLWGLCGHTACARARKCRGEPRDCLARCAPLVPPRVHDAVMLMREGKLLGLTFDELHARDPVAMDTFCDWSNAVADSLPETRRRA